MRRRNLAHVILKNVAVRAVQNSGCSAPQAARQHLCASRALVLPCAEEQLGEEIGDYWPGGCLTSLRILRLRTDRPIHHPPREPLVTYRLVRLVSPDLRLKSVPYPPPH